MKDARDLAKKIGSMSPDSKVKLTLIHNGSEKIVSLELGKMPKNTQAKANDDNKQKDNDSDNLDLSKLGLMLAPAERVAGAGSDGVVVTDVDSSGAAVDTPLYLRSDLPAGTKLEGPAIVDQLDSTTVVPPGLRADVDEWLNIRMHRQEER